MPKIMNFRSIFFLFLLSLLAVFFGFKLNVSLYFLFLLFVFLAWIVLLIFKKKFILLVVSISLLSFLTIYSFLFVKNYSNKNLENQTFTITARVSKQYNYNEQVSYVTLSDVVLLSANNKQNLKGNISATINNANNNGLLLGDKICFSAQVIALSLVNNVGEIETLYLKNNIRYELKNSVSINNIIVINNSNPLNEKIKEYNKKLLIDNMGNEYGNMAFGVLYGDTSDISKDTLEVFKKSGIMHIFSVSGLHITLFVALLYFLLNRFKRINDIAKLVIISAILLMYNYLCSFCAPVVRATIMSLTVLFSKVVFKKADILNSVAFAGVLILIFSPMSLFDGGFQMSFSAVFGILLLSKLFKNLKLNNKLLKYIFALLITTVSAQLALMPILAKYYGYYATWSIIGNLITIPLFSLFYTLLFVINLLCLILPFMSFLYFLPYSVLSIIVYENYIVSLLPFSYIKVFKWGSLTTIFYYLFLFSISNYVLLASKLKKWTISIIGVFVLILFCFNCLPSFSNKNAFCFLSETSSGVSAILTTKDNKFYLVNPTINKKSLKNIANELEAKRISNLFGIILTDNTSFEAGVIDEFLVTYKATLFLPKGHNAINNLKQRGARICILEENMVFFDNELNIQYLYSNNTFVASVIKIKNYKYLQFDYLKTKDTEFENLLANDFNFVFDCVKILNSNKNPYEDTLKFKNIVLQNQKLYNVVV